MKKSTMALVAAVLCFAMTFIVVPVLILADMPNPGFLAPTLGGLVLMLVWARAMAKGGS
jgi:hypothetical protein